MDANDLMRACDDPSISDEQYDDMREQVRAEWEACHVSDN